MIRRAKISEIPDILTITQACAKKMQENGIFQWNEHYPNPEAFQQDPVLSWISPRPEFTRFMFQQLTPFYLQEGLALISSDGNGAAYDALSIDGCAKLNG